MDSETIIVTIVLLSIAILPFVLNGYSREKQKKSLFRRLMEMAENDDCKITQHEFCANFVIGFAEMSDQFFFCKKVGDIEISQKINLREFQSCRIINSNRTVNHKKEHFYVIDKLELCFAPMLKNRSEIVLEIYNNEYDSLTLSGEMQLVRKWEKLLNEKLKKPQIPKRTISVLNAEPLKNRPKHEAFITLKG